MFPLKAFGCPKVGALCLKAEPVCPKSEPVCPKAKPVCPNVDVPKADVGVPNGEDEGAVAKGLDVELNRDGVVYACVVPKGLVCVPKGEELSVGVELANPGLGVPKFEVFWANGFVVVVEEKGFAAVCVNEGDEEKVFGCVLVVLNPIPPED
nr:hypothetical protein [Tanacetum cinerariifolium]